MVEIDHDDLASKLRALVFRELEERHLASGDTSPESGGVLLLEEVLAAVAVEQVTRRPLELGSDARPLDHTPFARLSPEDQRWLFRIACTAYISPSSPQTRHPDLGWEVLENLANDPFAITRLTPGKITRLAAIQALLAEAPSN